MIIAAGDAESCSLSLMICSIVISIVINSNNSIKNIGDNMPMVYVKNELYDNIIRNNKNPAKYVNDILEDAMNKEIPKELPK